jgi:hypothetical protein
MRLSAQALVQLVELTPQTFGPRVGRIRARGNEGPAIGDGMAIELAYTMALQGALDRQLLPVGLRAAYSAKD